MYVCLMSYEKTELLTLGDYMSNIAVSYANMSYVL
jgi:hypothetical protein